MATGTDDPPTITLDPDLDLVPASVDLPPALEAGRYEVGAVIGRGGMGTVVRCHDRRMDRDVAVKIVGGDTPDEQTRARFLAEARLQGQLQHPAIVPVYDVGRTDDGRELFVMREIEGVTLRTVLTRVRVGVEEPGRGRLLAAFSRVCMAVDYCHTRNVVHRDLKPDNIMLGEFGEVYVLDWGLAGTREALAGRQGGTRGYAAPEQLAGAPGPRSDVFALGVILSEILSLDPGDDAMFADREPPELVGLARRATDADPMYRPASARELAIEVDRFLDGVRDVALRRRLADEALAAASAAGTDDTPAVRRTALRGAGRALALEPDHAAARALLRDLLASPPDVPEVARRWAGHRREAIRAAATNAGIGLAFLFALTPVELAMGVRMPAWFGVRLALGVIATIACLGLGRLWRATRTATTIAFVAAAGVIGSTSLILGPFVLIPTLAALIAASLALLNGRRWLVLTSAAAIALIAVPLGLELIGAFPPSIRFAGGEVVLLPRMLDLPPTLTVFYMCAKDVVTLVVVGATLGRFRDALASAEQKLRLHAWQLEQLAG